MNDRYTGNQYQGAPPPPQSTPPYGQQPYGYQQPTGYQQPMPQPVYVNIEKESNGMGTAGFILSLLTILFSWTVVVGFILWFLGALFSFIGVFKRPRGLAIAGLIISFISIIILLIVVGAIGMLALF